MSDKVSLERRGDVTVVTIDNPPVNALSQPVRAGLMSAIDAFELNEASPPSRWRSSPAAGRASL